jgi:NADH pyrophosphatase NudC (nudix superfamily)
MLEEEKSLDEEVSEFLKERDRPPKEWWDKCVARIREGNKDYTDEQVNAVCGSMWYHQWGLGKSLDQEIIKAEYCPICGKVTEHKRARIGIRCVRCGHVKF